MPLRALLFILLLLNLLLFAGGYMGWLGTPAFRGEPERLTNQLHPEHIRPGTPAAAAAVATIDMTEQARAAAVIPPDEAAAPASSPDAPVKPPVVPPSATPDSEAAPAHTADERADPTPATPPPPACVAYDVAGEAAATEAEKLAQTISDDVRHVRRTLQRPEHWRVRIPPRDGTDAANARVTELRDQGVKDLFVVREEGPTLNSISLGLFSTAEHARQRLAALHKLGIDDAEIVSGSVGRFRVEFRADADIVAMIEERLERALPDAGKRDCQP